MSGSRLVLHLRTLLAGKSKPCTEPRQPSQAPTPPLSPSLPPSLLLSPRAGVTKFKTAEGWGKDPYQPVEAQVCGGLLELHCLLCAASPWHLFCSRVGKDPHQPVEAQVGGERGTGA